jgi:two-component system sensor histidine kinase PhoQ
LIAVDDDGPGFLPENVALILQRGVRDERARPRIGLAIVQDLVRGYRGTSTCSRPRAGRTRFEVKLPPGWLAGAVVPRSVPKY